VSNVPRHDTPALFTKIVTGPNSFSVRATTASIAAALRRISMCRIVHANCRATLRQETRRRSANAPGAACHECYLVGPRRHIALRYPCYSAIERLPQQDKSHDRDFRASIIKPSKRGGTAHLPTTRSVHLIHTGIQARRSFWTILSSVNRMWCFRESVLPLAFTAGGGLCRGSGIRSPAANWVESRGTGIMKLRATASACRLSVAFRQHISGKIRDCGYRHCAIIF
jgi:hypothetical protein